MINEQMDFETAQQRAFDTFGEWYQTVGCFDTDEIRRDYIIEYYEGLAEKSRLDGLAMVEYEKFIEEMNKAYEDDYSQVGRDFDVR